MNWLGKLHKLQDEFDEFGKLDKLKDELVSWIN